MLFKALGTFFQTFACDLGFAAYETFCPSKCQKLSFPGIFFGFAICNLKLFHVKNRSSIVPSLRNMKNIKFLMILMSKSDIFQKQLNLDNMLPVKINFPPKTKIVRMVHMNIFYEMDLQISDSKR